jgi:pimeloyl-ACP methyl ester carboxylesterase
MRPALTCAWLLAFGVAAAFISADAAPAGSDGPPVARQGYLFAGGKYSMANGKRVMSGQIYAEFQIPKSQTHRYPIVMVHGAIQTGSNFTGTPDGRMGWAEYFLRQGYAVYVVDQPGRGRASYDADIEGPQAFPDLNATEQRFTAPERSNLWPQARLHTQWPGSGLAGDPVFDQFYMSQVPFVRTPEKAQEMTRDALAALLEKIGPAIVMTHSQSGSMGWLLADARPELVRALIQVEPAGPPVHDVDMVGAPDYLHDGAAVRPWGLAAIAMGYMPRAASATELSFVQESKADGPGLARCWLQQAPARQLPNLAKMPMLVMNGEASFHAPFEHCTVKYLEQAGVHPSWINLGKAGLHGNGHMMMLEKNNLEVAALIESWLAKSLPAETAAR